MATRAGSLMLFVQTEYVVFLLYTKHADAQLHANELFKLYLFLRDEGNLPANQYGMTHALRFLKSVGAEIPPKEEAKGGS